MKRTSLTLSILLLFAANISSSNCKHEILGGTACFTEGEHEIISDIKINDLQIREVRELGNAHCNERNEVHIELAGPIEEDSVFVMERVLKRVIERKQKNNCKTFKTDVYIHSGGGFMEDGIELGRVFRKHNVHTIVSNRGKCMSSCAAAFLGGRDRTLNPESELLFHAPYQLFKGTYYEPIQASCPQESRELRDYFIEMLDKEDGNLLYQRTMKYCGPEKGWLINPDAARIFNIID